MDQHEIAYALEKFATDAGFEPEQSFYITGEFRVVTAHVASFYVVEAPAVLFYSDEAHLYCEPCARKLLEKVFPFLREDERDDHEVYMADSSSPEDTPPACATCGKTLRHCLTEGAGVGQELWQYRENPIELGEVISPDTAYCIAQIVSSAYGDEDIADAIALGESALAAIKSAPTASGGTL